MEEALAIGEENRRLVLEFLRSRPAGEPPSIGEIAREVGLSRSSVHHHLLVLVDRGVLRREDAYPVECHLCHGTGVLPTTRYLVV
jgi:DNA-binding transcriptional ArsR family regulator